ncbi:MAG TPA: peptide chain release factor-like protein [Candidatus Peribacteraceae bacterium]|nr:peptide chain release factor-like protein [Candidatus Peribacteraceae bacterium]
MPFPIDLPKPSLDMAAELQVRAEDVEEKFIRGSGHGGQKINKTSSTVHLKHLPTGIEVKVQKYREQSKNRLSAWKLLILKIEEQVKGKESKKAREIFKIRKQKARRSRRAKETILDEKHHRAFLKDLRRDDLHF